MLFFSLRVWAGLSEWVESTSSIVLRMDWVDCVRDGVGRLMVRTLVLTGVDFSSMGEDMVRLTSQDVLSLGWERSVRSRCSSIDAREKEGWVRSLGRFVGSSVCNRALFSKRGKNKRLLFLNDLWSDVL